MRASLRSRSLASAARRRSTVWATPSAIDGTRAGDSRSLRQGGWRSSGRRSCGGFLDRRDRSLAVIAELIQLAPRGALPILVGPFFDPLLEGLAVGLVKQVSV